MTKFKNELPKVPFRLIGSSRLMFIQRPLISGITSSLVLIGSKEQLISGTNSSLEGNLRGVFSEWKIHCLGRLRRDSLLERLSRP